MSNSVGDLGTNDVAKPEVLTKLLSIIEYPNNDAQVELIKECFDGLSIDEVQNSVMKILQNISLYLLDQSEMFSRGDLADVLVSQNLGSLYDEIVFEVSVYLDQNRNFHYNCSFGRQVNPELKASYCLRHASDVSLFLANNFDAKTLNEFLD